jgi:hypothetical protein
LNKKQIGSEFKFTKYNFYNYKRNCIKIYVKFDKQKFHQTKLNAKNHHIVGTKQNIFVNDVVPKNKTKLQNYNRNHRNKIKLQMLTQKLSQDYNQV